LYSVLRLSTQSRDELIRKRHAEGEGLSELARAYNISPQRVHQIVHYK
jgi:Mor family transcriptional regulator